MTETTTADADRPGPTAVVPPAEDFYRHVNGAWLDANPVPPEYGSWGAFHEVNERNQALLHRLLGDVAATPGPAGTPARMAGDYFAAGMDEAAIAAAGTTPLQPLLHRIDAAGSLAEVRQVVRDLQRHGVGALHSLGITSDFEDAEAYLPYLGQGGLGLPEREYYLQNDERSVGLREAYVDHVAAQLGHLGTPAGAARVAAEAILAFERRLAEASLPAADLRDVTRTLNRVAVADLDELMPGFGLTGHLRDLGVTSASVSVDHPDFFRALDATLAEAPIDVLRPYLRWHLVRSYASSLSPEIEREAFEFYGRRLGGQQEQKPRWKRVLEAATGDIGEQVAQLYVDVAFPPRAKARCEELVDHLLSAMERSIRGADWMTDPTRAEALAKLAAFTYKIGYPERWRDYGALEIDRTSYAGNRMRAAAFEHDRQVGRLDQPVDRDEWGMPPHIVNAYYHPLLNQIVFPAGILQPPFFDDDADDATNYGAIGAVIGHEITHGFDDQGSHFDAAGRFREWWTEDDRAEFERRAQVLVDQYDAYEVEEGVHVNGRLTLGENIADLGGIAIAYDALREAAGDVDAPAEDGTTPAQRFFRSWAVIWRMNTTEEHRRLMVTVDPHSPTNFRANGPLANFPAFAAAFDVPDGAPMVRAGELQTRIW